MVSLSTFAFVLIVITSMVILVFRDWRINAVSMAIQYLAAFYLITLSWPIGLAVVKLVAGWMAVAAIALTCLRYKRPDSLSEPTSSLFFRGFAGLLTMMLIFIIGNSLQEQVFPDVQLVIIQGGVMLMGMALMQLGTNSETYLVIFSLLTFLSGFEVIHAALELSTLLTGLLVVVNLGLALVGVYLLVSAGEGDHISEEEGPA